MIETALMHGQCVDHYLVSSKHPVNGNGDFISIMKNPS